MMFLKASLLLVIAVAGTWGYSVDVRDADVGILGGASVEDEAGFVALIYYSRRFTCAGSIINDQYILTSAACVQEADVGNYTVFVGTHVNTLWGYRHEVESRVIHENYNEVNGDNDVALLKLKGTIELMPPNIRTVKLVKKDYNLRINQKFTVFGWGMNEKAVISNILYKGQSHVVPKNTCAAPGTSTQFCGAGATVCFGDGGGPAVLASGADNEVQIGIISIKQYTKADECEGPSFYTDLTAVVDWVNEKAQLKQ